MREVDSALNIFRQKDKIRVLFCIDTLSGGGAEKLLIDILKRFDYGRYCVDLLLYKRHGVYLSDVPDEVQVLASEDAKYLTQRKYDVEIAFLEGLSTKFIARRDSDAQKIAWVHTDLYDHHWTKTFYENDTEEAGDYSRMDGIVFVSRDAKRQFNELFPNVEVSQAIIYNLIDADEINRRSNAFRIDKRKSTLCSVGRLTEVKGYSRLIRVIDRLVHEDGFDIELWILGVGEQKQALEDLIRQYSLEEIVFLKGFQKNPYPYIKAADLFVLPSFAEGFSLVVAEALCLGKPILATECSGPKEMLNNGACGMLVENNDDAIFRGLKKMIKDEALRGEYARKALTRSKMFDSQIYKLLHKPKVEINMDLNERILNHIILASAPSRNPGLIDGKTGIILFLMHYAKSSGNEIYREIAEDMLDELWTDINVSTPIGLSSGLCGVGWGIEYLIQNDFVDGDGDEICEEVDKAVRHQKIYPEMNRTLDFGIEGMLHYIMARIVGNRTAGRPMPFELALMEDLYGVTKNKRTGIFALFNHYYTDSPYEYRLSPIDFIPNRVKIKKVLAENQLGLRGLTGYLFKQLESHA